ncbi:MAG TPA: hypothetical protein VM182_06245 [Terriglobia bacterium]|nr:hypothetical protein [Terriglobia bacterium]
MKRLATAFSLVLVYSSLAVAQNFSRTYVLESGEGDTVLTVQQDAQGKVRGTLQLDDGTTFQLAGEIKNNEAIGIASVQDKSSLFKLRFQGGQLIYTIVAVGPDGKPDLANAQGFPFTHQGGGGGASPSPLASLSALTSVTRPIRRSPFSTTFWPSCFTSLVTRAVASSPGFAVRASSADSSSPSIFLPARRLPCSPPSPSVDGQSSLFSSSHSNTSTPQGGYDVPRLFHHRWVLESRLPLTYHFRSIAKRN